MAGTVCSNSRIGIVKTFFGLCTKVVYLPTDSRVEVKRLEYDAETGTRWKRILARPEENVRLAVAGFKPQATTNGNYMLEACVSRDGNFVALLLLQYEQLGYEPVSDVVVFEGEEAKALSLLL